jgi:hypothetical protein
MYRKRKTKMEIANKIKYFEFLDFMDLVKAKSVDGLFFYENVKVTRNKKECTIEIFGEDGFQKLYFTGHSIIDLLSVYETSYITAKNNLDIDLLSGYADLTKLFERMKLNKNLVENLSDKGTQKKKTKI